MSKELKALEILEYLDQISKEEIVVRNGNTVYTNSREKPPFTRLTTVGTYFKGIDDVKQAIQKLDFYEDAMDLTTNCFSIFKNRNGDEITVMRKERYEEYEKQEKENAKYKKALNVIFENPSQSEVTIVYIKTSINPTYEDYCFMITEEYQLPQDEFDLLNEVFKND